MANSAPEVTAAAQSRAERLRRIESALNAFFLPKYDPSGRPDDRSELREESEGRIYERLRAAA